MNHEDDTLMHAAEKLAAMVAGVDEDEPESLSQIAEALNELSERYSLSPDQSTAAEDAMRAILEVKEGCIQFEAGYECLSAAIESLCRASEAAPVGETPSSIERAVLEDFEMQLTVLGGLLAEMEGKDSNIINFSRNVFNRIEEQPFLHAHLVENLAAMQRALEDIEADVCTISEGIEAACAAVDAMKCVLDGLKSSGQDEESTQAGEEEASDESERLERHVSLLEEMEQDILLMEKGDARGAEEILKYVNMLKGQPEATGALADILLYLESAVRTIAARPTHDNVTVLLDIRDVLYEYYSLRAEGDQAAALDEEALASLCPTLQELAASGSPGRPEETRAASAVQIEAERTEIIDFVTETPEYIQLAESALMELEKDPRDAESLNGAFRGFHNIKGSAGFLKLADIVQVAHDAESLLSDARDGQTILDGPCFTATLQALDILRDMVEQLRGVLDGKSYFTPDSFPQVIAALRSVRETGALVSADGPTTERPAPVGAISQKPESGRASAEADVKKRSGDGFIKVSTTRLDNLIDAVGELVISHSMVMQEREIIETRNPNLQKNVSQLAKITRELQELSMSMRMVSLKSTFQKMSRIVRDLQAKSNVLLDFTCSGEDTEIDRNMVEEINAPLVHMVRNAVDHGIESPDERIKNGKPERGHVHLAGYHEGGKVVLELTDDGKGLDRDKIFNKAVSLGIVKPDARLTDSEVFGLILREGLSTAEKVTDISGRGVGMDVVRSAVEKLRGRVELSSTPGNGTRVTIRLPLTLSIIDGMVVKVSDEHYVVPSFAILESFRPTVDQLSTVFSKGEMVDVRTETLPLFRLHELFKIQGAKRNPSEALVLVIGENGSRCALMVDDIVGQQQVVIKSLGEMFTGVSAVSGGAIMGSGRVALILDPQGVVQMAHAAS